MILEIGFAASVSLFLILIYKYIKHLRSLRHYPPGPFPLPLVGNLHQIGTKPHLTLREMAKTYGDVFTVSFGTERVLVLNTIEPTKEALIKRSNSFANRPKSYPIELLSEGYKTIGFADSGRYHSCMRKISHRALKMFGDGKERIETFIVDESVYLHQRLRNMEGQPVAVHYEIGLSILNVICDLVFGHRYHADDSEYKEVIDFTTLLFQGLACCDAVAVFPWLRHFPLDGISKMRAGLKIRNRLYEKKIQHHKSTFNPNQMRDCTDVILSAFSEEKTLKNAGISEATDDHVKMLVNDLFVGGLETTTTVLRWAIVYLLHWPRYQDQIYEEIKRVVGDDRYPEMRDRENMHIMHAFIQETLRFATIAPLNVPRRTTEKTEVGGFSVPKDTQVLFNMWNIHRDSQHWEDPDAFIPERFTDDNGKYITGTCESFLPFSAGRRVCFGEALAKMELFLFLSRLLRDYSIEKAPGEELPPLEGELGVTLCPQSFNALFISRNNNLIS